MKLHAPKDGEYRSHIYEGQTLCFRTGWIANKEDRVTCTRCLRKLEHDPQQIGMVPK